MSVAIACPGCAKIINADAEGRLPPWCRHCGASFTASAASGNARAPATADPGAPAPVAAEARPAAAPPPRVLFIQGCDASIWSSDRALHRIYLTGSDLLVFQIGYGVVSAGEVIPRTKPRRVFAGGMAGAMAMMREAERSRLAARIPELDEADESALRRYAAEW